MGELDTPLPTAICTVIKNEARYLTEWIAFHLTIGFEQFYIYDNESTDGTSDLLRALESRGYVHYTPWATPLDGSPQLLALQHFIKDQCASLSDFVAFIDADEFVALPTACTTVADYFVSNGLNDDSISAVAANQRVFGSSGETEYRPEFVIERFVKSSEEDYPENRWFKSFFRPSKMKNVRNPHFIFPMDGRYTDVAGDDLDQAAICNGALPRITPGLRINHYILKSLSEYRDKQSRGCADGIAHRFERYDESYFFGRDTYINTAERAFPAQFVEKVHAKEREVLGEIGSGKVASGNHVLPSKALLTAGAISDDVYLAKLMRSISEPTELGGLTLPSFPPEQTQIATVGVSGEAAVRQAWSFVSQVLPHFKRSSLFADTDKALLDFGVGWGRISRCFLRDFKVENIIGVDISERYLGICGETFPQLRTERANVFPPLSLGTATIDFIVSYSVFSHLSEVACKAWAQEFYELLRPGGVAAITTRSRAFFDTHEEYAVKKMGGAPLFNSYAAAKAKYDRGEMVHSDTEMRKPNRTHYSETFIPQSYAKEKLWPLRLVEFYSERGLAVMIFDKP